MSLRIRPYVSVAESIARTAPNLLSTTMPTILIGPAVSERQGFDTDLNFSVKNNASIADLKALDANGKIFKIAGIREGSTLVVDTLKFGAYNLTSTVNFGSEELHVHVKSSTEKYILVLETGDKYVTEQELIDKGIIAGDNILIEPPSADEKPFNAKIREFEKDTNGNLLIYLWDEVPYDVDDSTSLKAHIIKSFSKVYLTTSGFEFDAVPSFGESVLIKGPGSFDFNYYVYKPTDATPFFDNIKVALTPLKLVNTTITEISASADDGQLSNWFTANRTDLANQILDINYNNYQNIIGKPSEKNKLGNMLEIIANEVPGFDIKVFVTETDSDDAYIKALNILSTSTKGYQIACLTDSMKVFGALTGSVEKGAQPEISAYKLGVFCPRLSLYTKKIEIKDGTITDNGNGTYTIESPTGGFSLVDIKVGDAIIGSNDLEIADEEYYNAVGEPYSGKVVAKVQAIITDKKIIVAPIVTSLNVIDALSGQDIVILNINNKQEVGESIGNLAKQTNDMHIVLVFPDKYIVNDKLMPGYYIAGLIAAVMGHLPPQQGLSNLSFKTVKQVIGSAFVYTDIELDSIAANGVSVITQISHDSAPFIIRQLTTNMDSLEEMEINKVRCLDFAALAIKDSIDGYVGKRNVTQRNVTDIQDTLNALLGRIIKETSNDLLGSIITSYKINYLQIPTDEPDAIIGDIEVNTPTSLNAIRLFVKSKS